MWFTFKNLLMISFFFLRGKVIGFIEAQSYSCLVRGSPWKWGALLMVIFDIWKLLSIMIFNYSIFLFSWLMPFTSSFRNLCIPSLWRHSPDFLEALFFYLAEIDLWSISKYHFSLPHINIQLIWHHLLVNQLSFT